MKTLGVIVDWIVKILEVMRVGKYMYASCEDYAGFYISRSAHLHY